MKIKYSRTLVMGVMSIASVLLFALAFAQASTATTIGTNLSTDGTLTVNGNSTLGNATSDTLTAQGKVTITLQDNTTDSFDLQEGTSNYININTTNSSETITLGSASLTSITITTDGTGNGEVVLPNDSIGTAEILDDTVSATDLSATLTFADADLIDLGAILHNDATAQGLRLPNVGASPTDITGSSEGYLAWNETNNQLLVNDGTSWITAIGNTTAANTWTDNQIFTFAGDEDIAITSDAGANANVFNITITPNASNFAIQAIKLDQADSANGNGIDAFMEIDNSDTNLAVATGILFSSAGGAITTGIDFNSTAVVTDIQLQNGETIDNDTDDMIVFTGTGGSVNTDLRIDLDGTNPVIDSPTGSAIEFADPIQFPASQSPDITTASNEDLQILPGGTGNIVLTADGDSEVQVVVASAAPTADIFQVTNAGLGVTSTSGVDAVSITYVQATNGANITGSAIDIAVTQSGDAGDTIQGINIGNITGGSSTETALSIGSGWDSDLKFVDSSPFISLADGSTLTIANATGTNFITFAAGTVTLTGNLLPEAAGTRDLGSTSAEWGSIYTGDDTGINLGLDQDALLAYDETTDDRVELTGTGASLFIEDRLALGMQTFTMSTGGAATETLTPTASFVKVTGQDSASDKFNISEASAKTGDILFIYNDSSTTVSLEKSTTARIDGGADISLTQYDAVLLIYNGGDWLQVGKVVNNL